MKLTLKEIGEIVGYQVEADDKFDKEEFVSHLNKSFVSRENVFKDDEIKGQITGKVLGSITTEAARIFSLKSSEIKDKKLEEVLQLGKSKYETELQAAKELAGKGNEDVVKEYTTKIGALEKALQDNQAAWESEKGTYTSQIDQLNGTVKSVKLGVKRNEAFKGVSFVDEYTTDELKRAGFESIINNTYDLDLDENEELVVKSKKDGAPVLSKKNAGKYAPFSEVLTMEAEAKGLLKKNNAPKEITRPIQSRGLTIEVKSPQAQKAQDNLAKMIAARG